MSQRRLIICTVAILTLVVSPLFILQATFVHAQSEVERLKDQIDDRNARLIEIEEEIKAYKTELQKVGAEKSTLQKAINQLELERKKVQADISYTQNKIGATDLEISKLNLEIEETKDTIGRNEQAISEVLRRLDETDKDSLIEILLRYDNLSEFWGTIDELGQIRLVMSDEVKSLVSQKLLLEDKHEYSIQKRGELVGLKAQYLDQNAVLANTKEEKDELLTTTKNEEANYQTLLAEREAAKKRFEQELRDLEAQLQFILDPNTIPPPGTPVFAWPLDSVRITQYFGDTEFARSAAYNGNGHNGIDLGASRGTPVRAALAGKVIAVNTRVAAMCQYGKWVLIRHANGLTTLYAHLSVVSVDEGDTVSTEKTVGYSGDTGYATGPHLHFTVYASQAVNFTKYTCNSGVTLTIPVSARSGYLNPLDYLPAS